MNCSDFFTKILEGGNQVAFFKNNESVCAEQLKTLALDLRDELNSRDEQRWLIWADDAGNFLIQFIALCMANKTIIMPGNAKAGTLSSLSEHFDAALVDATILPEAIKHYELCTQFDTSASTRSNTTPTFDTLSLLELNPEIILFTSGSTGKPKAVQKTLKHLLLEIDAQQQTWGDRVQCDTVVSTVSHQHIYGLLHFVLWPLCRSAPFVAEAYQYPEELIATVKHHAPVVLVSSPTHLQRLPLCSDYINHHSKIRLIFSSTGLLVKETAQSLEKINGDSPLEIFGSTETGGVAWRQQNKLGSLWRAFPKVKVTQEPTSGCLLVESQHASGNEAHLMGDLVQFNQDGLFELKGRADRIVKVEGKRLSLNEIESKLSEHPWVKSARITIIKSKREEVAAVVVLHDNVQYPAVTDKKTVNRQLQAHLSAFYEKTLLPRRWRYRESLPVDRQGKSTYDLLQACFSMEEI